MWAEEVSMEDCGEGGCDVEEGRLMGILARDADVPSAMLEDSSSPTSTCTLDEPNPIAATDAKRSRRVLCNAVRSEPF